MKYGKLILKSASFLFIALITGIGVGLLWSKSIESQVTADLGHAAYLNHPGPKERARIPIHCVAARRSSRSVTHAPARHNPLLPRFRGDTVWIHRREGHVGQPYWPGGSSGITLDPGIDLGHVEPWLVEETLGSRLTNRQLNAVRNALGTQGVEAKTMLRRSSTLRSIEVSRSTAAEIFPYLLRPYWRSLQRRFVTLDEPDIPPEIQTALLSIAYNRGAWNPDLTPLLRPFQTRQWNVMAEMIHGMQQDHSLAGIRSRRRVESLLISQNLVNEPSILICHRPG